MSWYFIPLGLHYHSCSFGIRSMGIVGCQAVMTSSLAAASLMCHHQSETPAVTSRVTISQRGVACSACHQSVPAYCCGCNLACSAVSASVMLIGNGSPWFLNRQTMRRAAGLGAVSLSLSIHWESSAKKKKNAAARRNISMRSGCCSGAFEQKWCWIASSNSYGKCVLWKRCTPRKTEIKKGQKNWITLVALLWVKAVLNSQVKSRHSMEIFKRWSIR